jgi:hypothetical protein
MAFSLDVPFSLFHASHLARASICPAAAAAAAENRALHQKILGTSPPMFPYDHSPKLTNFLMLKELYTY